MVVRELPRIRSRDRRAEMEAALADAVRAADATRAAAWEASQAARAEAGVRRPDDAAAGAGKTLAGTDAIAGDLGAWLLERHTGAKPGSAALHDVLHLVSAPRCASAFIAGELHRTVRRWAEMLRLDLSELKLDEEDRPLKWAGAHAEPLDPPY